MTLEELATEINRSPQTISDMESGAHIPSEKIALSLLRVFESTVTPKQKIAFITFIIKARQELYPAKGPVGEWLQDMCVGLLLFETDLAAEAGLKPPRFTAIKAGDFIPTDETVDRLLVVLKGRGLELKQEQDFLALVAAERLRRKEAASFSRATRAARLRQARATNPPGSPYSPAMDELLEQLKNLIWGESVDDYRPIRRLTTEDNIRKIMRGVPVSEAVRDQVVNIVNSIDPELAQRFQRLIIVGPIEARLSRKSSHQVLQ